MSPEQLPIYEIGGVRWYRDKRLSEYRQVDNPHERMSLWDGDRKVNRGCSQEYMFDENGCSSRLSNGHCEACDITCPFPNLRIEHGLLCELADKILGGYSCPDCNSAMMYLEYKRYFRCVGCKLDIAQDGTRLE